MRYILLICADESGDAGVEPGRGRGDDGRVHEVRRGDDQAGRPAGRRAPAPDDRRDDRAGPQRRGAHLRRSVRGDQGADRRLLPGRRQGSRRGDRDRGEDPGRAGRHDRSEADLGDVPAADRRGRGRGRRRLPLGVGSRRRDPHPGDRRLGPRRGVRAGRLRAGAGALAARRRPAQPRRLAHDDRAQPCARSSAPRRDRGGQARGGGRDLAAIRRVATTATATIATTAASKTTACA